MEIIIDKSNADQRFDRFLRKRFKIYPKVRLADIYALIRKGSAKVNAKKQKEQYRLNVGDLVSIDDHVTLGDADFSVLTSGKEKQLEKVDIRKIQDRIIYSDQHWLVFNKPAGILVHPGNQHWKDLSMNDYLEKVVESWKLKVESSNVAVTFKPAFGYRLDKDTSGVLIAAKTYDALQYINKIIRERQIDKYYLALVMGTFPDHLLIDKPLEKQYNERFDRAQVKVDFRYGVSAKTECRWDKTFTHEVLGECSLVRIKIETWRMHQIRVHLADAWFPVLGDLVYGNPALNRIMHRSLGINRQLLHCRKYSFFDYFSQQQCKFEAPIPADFNKVLGKE